MTPFAHIAGIPVEETALSFGPVLLTAGGLPAPRLRSTLGRIRATVAGQDENRRPAAR